jgi:antitoxin (DNA-binding transcriptional repressor) of toxin-antitoxin stability system
MRVVKVGDAKNNLSRHLAYVQRGGRVRILQRDLPVADLVPIDSVPVASSEEADLARLERLGLIRRGNQGPLPRELMRAGPSTKRARVTEALLNERRSSR